MYFNSLFWNMKTLKTSGEKVERHSFKSLIQWYVNALSWYIHVCIKLSVVLISFYFIVFMFDFVELTQPQNPQSKKFHVFLYKIGTHFTTIGTPLWPQGNSLYDLAPIINHSIHYLRVNLFLVTPHPHFRPLLLPRDRKKETWNFRTLACLCNNFTSLVYIIYMFF